MVHDGNTGKIQKARIIMARAIRVYLTPICGNLGFPSSMLVELLALEKFAGTVTALFGCVVPRGSLFP